MTRPPRWARRFVAIFLFLFALSGLIGIEAWPLTGWRLFSRLRTDAQASWQAVTVDARGVESPIPFGRLPWAYRGHVHVLNDFPYLSAGQRAAVCDTWSRALEAEGAGVQAVRVYRTRWRISVRAGLRAAPGSRSLRFECAGGGGGRD